MIERLEVEKITQDLEVIKERLLLVPPPRIRLGFSEPPTLTPRTMLVIGPRGVGKTTFLLNQLKDKHYLYVSLDNPLVSRISMWDLADHAFLKGYEGIVFDEVHFSKDWSLHLKALYDAHPQRAKSYFYMIRPCIMFFKAMWAMCVNPMSPACG